MMNRQGKEALVTSLRQDLSSHPVSFLVEVKGLKVEELQTLRRQLRDCSGKLQVAKVRLMKRAMQDVASAQGLENYMKEQIALVFVKQDAAAVAKLLCDFSKDHESLKIVAGCMDAQVIDKDAVKLIATLPPREVLLAQLAATMQAPITNLAYVLHQLMFRLVYVLKQIEEKKTN